MSGITKDQNGRIQEAAMEIVFDYSIKKLDAIDTTTIRKAILRGLSYQLVAEFGVTINTARQHIAKACRRQRYPKWEAPEVWGGKRSGAGAKSSEYCEKTGSQKTHCDCKQCRKRPFLAG